MICRSSFLVSAKLVSLVIVGLCVVVCCPTVLYERWHGITRLSLMKEAARLQDALSSYLLENRNDREASAVQEEERGDQVLPKRRNIES